MASKVSPFILASRFSRNYRSYSSPTAACVHNLSESNQSFPDFDSAARFLKNNLHPDRLIQVLDSTSDSTSAVSIFKWASRQKNFWQTPETYARIVQKLGMAGDLKEMENFLKEMVRLNCSSAGEALGFLIHSFCTNSRPQEALLVFEIASLANYKLPVSACNVLLGALDSKKGNFNAILFVYKEMTKAGVFPDVETLNYLIEGLCEAGHLDIALEQFDRMNKKHCVPNSWTFEILISALCGNNRIEDSVKVFNKMIEIGCSPNLGFYNTIIPLFCRLNRFEEGTKLLGAMRDSNLLPGLYLYCVLIECLCENRRLVDAIKLFEEMTASGYAPVTSTYVDIVNGYCELGNLGAALNFLEEYNTLETEPSNTLLKGYCNDERFPQAISFLDKMTERGLTDNLSWNILIRGLCERGYVKKAFEILCRMIVCSCGPDDATYSAIITGYCKLGKYCSALSKYREACVEDMSLDAESCSDLIEGLCHIKKIPEASEIFDYMVGKCCRITSNSLVLLIRELCLDDKLEEAIRLRSLAFRSGTACTPLTYATIMVKLLEMNKINDAFTLLSQMFVEGCAFDGATYCVVIRGLCTESTVREAVILFDRMVHSGFLSDHETLETLIPCAAMCSRVHLIMQSLGKLFDEEGLLTQTMCNKIVSALLKEGHKYEARKVVDWMLDKGWVPDAGTHSLLVGNIDVEGRDGTIEGYKNDDADKVSNILAEGLENYDHHIVEE